MELRDKLEALKTIVNLRKLANKEDVISTMLEGIYGKNISPHDTITYGELGIMMEYRGVLRKAISITGKELIRETEELLNNITSKRRRVYIRSKHDRFHREVKRRYRELTKLQKDLGKAGVTNIK